MVDFGDIFGRVNDSVLSECLLQPTLYRDGFECILWWIL